MTDNFEVRPTDLITHATHLEASADRVATAQQAGAVVRAGGGAYGELCTMVPAMLGALQDILIDGIASAADSLHDTGSRLRTTAQAYQAADERRSQDLIQIYGRR